MTTTTRRMFAAFLLTVLVLCVCDPTKASPARVRRQGWQWGGQSNGNQNQNVRPPLQQQQSTSSPQPPPANNGGAPSAAFRTCFAECTRQTLPQYNPVCGSDQITYDNRAKLECAQECGTQGLTVLFNGTCQPL